MLGNSSRTRQNQRSSFLIKVLFQQNESWQGTITWLDKDKTVNFRNTTDLLEFMDSACNHKYQKKDADSVEGG
jgi:hypothetical protein